MSIPKRHVNAPGTYFVTSRTWQSRALFVAEPICNIFVNSLLHYRDEGKFSLHAYVLMRDHFHLLITSSEDISLERAVQFIKGGSARRIAQELLFRFPVWQKGFSDHRIRDAQDFATHLAYLNFNPVKKHLAAAPEEYPWSSANGKWRTDPWPQRLKPPSNLDRYGTAKAMP
ncbi:MAG TPA: transposase [Candidatus Acidoferrales bacterium]|nr:transposase [Candidatus Acidoferrales bacterium]